MANRHVTQPQPRDVRYIFRPWRRCPQTGEKLWAKDFGLKAWRIPVMIGGDGGSGQTD